MTPTAVVERHAVPGTQPSWAQIPAPPLTSCSSLGNLLSLSVPPLSHLSMESHHADLTESTLRIKGSLIGLIGAAPRHIRISQHHVARDERL